MHLPVVYISIRVEGNHIVLFIYSVIPQKEVKYLSSSHILELVIQNNQNLVKERNVGVWFCHKMSEEWCSSFTVWCQCSNAASGREEALRENLH